MDCSASRRAQSNTEWTARSGRLKVPGATSEVAGARRGRETTKRVPMPSGEPRPVGLLLDICVWLDLAGNNGNEPLLSAVESLCRQHVFDLLVPQLVRDEFVQNKQRIVKESGRSLSGALKRARVALWTYGDPRKGSKSSMISTTG